MGTVNGANRLFFMLFPVKTDMNKIQKNFSVCILSPSCFAILQLYVSFQYFIFLDCAILIKYLYTMLSVAGKYTAIDTPKTHINKLISLHKSRQYLSLLFRKKDKYTFWPFEIEHFKCIVSFFFESILSPLFIKWQNLY